MTREKAIEILIAVAVCDRPILSCDFCARYAGIGTHCNYPPDGEIEEAVLLLKGASKDMAISALQQQDVTDKYVGEMTNADRIRAMSDEELCDLLDEWWCMGANNDERLAYADERLAWLQKPAGEEDKHEP